MSTNLPLKIRHILRNGFILAASVNAFLIMMGTLILHFVFVRRKKPFKANPADYKNKEKKDKAPLTILRRKLNKEGREWHQNCKCESLSIHSFDGLKLYGELVPAKNCTSNQYVILVHGYSGSRLEMYTFGKDYYDQGYHVLFIDLRSHGKSEGRYITMGWLDRMDMQEWINLLIKRNQNARIVLHGISMGAATVMMTAGEKLPSHVKACVEDCGYTSVSDIFAKELWALLHLPPFPLMHITSKISKHRAGYSFQDASCIRQLQKCKIPMLFIHGKEDTFVPYSMMQPLYDACAAPKEKYIVKGAGHVESRCADLKRYNEKVFTFLDKHVK